MARTYSRPRRILFPDERDAVPTLFTFPINRKFCNRILHIAFVSWQLLAGIFSSAFNLFLIVLCVCTVQVITSDYLNSSSSLRDRRARIVVLQFRLASLDLDQHARDKFIRLLRER